MADISRIHILIDGVMRGLDLTQNTLVMQSIKIGSSQLHISEVGGELDFGAAKLTNIADAVNPTDVVPLGQLDSVATGEGASLIGIEDAGGLITATDVEGALAEIAGDVDDLTTLIGAPSATDLGTFTGTTIPDSQTVKQALQALETYSEQNRSLIQNFEWQESAIDRVDTPPGSPVSGDRYLVIATATGDFAGQENKIAEYNGSSWVFTDPAVGMYIAIDDEADGLYLYGGASWEKKYFEATTASTGLTKSGFDVRLADAALSSGIQVSSGAISLGLATDPGLEFSSNALRVKIKAASGLVRDTDGLSVTLGDFDTDDLAEGTALYFTETRVRDTVLTGFVAAAGTVAATDTVLEALEKLQGNFDDLDASDIAYTPAVLADWDASTDPGNVDDALDQLAERVADLEGAATDSVAEVMTAGETFAANTLIAVRMAKGAETAGRVYKADKDASVSDDFYVIGLAIPGAEVTAGNPVTVVKLGRITATAHGFTVGAPIFLNAAGALTGTAPSAADEAVVRVGIARTANEIEVQPQVVCVN